MAANGLLLPSCSTAIPQAGPEGILTPELSKKLGSAPKVLLRSLPELCRKYGMKVRLSMQDCLLCCCHLLSFINDVGDHGPGAVNGSAS